MTAAPPTADVVEGDELLNRLLYPDDDWQDGVLHYIAFKNDAISVMRDRYVPFGDDDPSAGYSQFLTNAIRENVLLDVVKDETGVNAYGHAHIVKKAGGHTTKGQARWIRDLVMRSIKRAPKEATSAEPSVTSTAGVTE